MGCEPWKKREMKKEERRMRGSWSKKAVRVSGNWRQGLGPRCQGLSFVGSGRTGVGWWRRCGWVAGGEMSWGKSCALLCLSPFSAAGFSGGSWC